MNQNLRQVLSGVSLVLIQVFLFNQMTLLEGIATPYVFLIFLFFFPIDAPLPVQYLVGFSTGLLIDVLSLQGPIGLHAFVATFFMGVRMPVIQLIGTSASTSKLGGDRHLAEQPWGWYFTCFLPMILLYMLLYVFLEAMTLDLFWSLMGKVLVSGVYTFFVCMILWYIFYRTTRSGNF